MFKYNIPCGTKFLPVLSFAIFAVFPAIRKNKFPQTKITANIFPAKIYSRVNILKLKFATQKYSTKKSCLFNHNLSLSFRNSKYWFIAWKYVFVLHVLNKKENIINLTSTAYFLKSPKLIPSKKNQSVPIAKISFRKTQKIDNPQK